MKNMNKEIVQSSQVGIFLPVQVEGKVVDELLRVETSCAGAAVRGDRTVAGGHRAQRVVTTVDLRLKQKQKSSSL